LVNIANKEYITVNELTEWLGIGKTKAYDLVQRGELPSVRIGRAIRIPTQGVREWLNDGSKLQRIKNQKEVTNG